jgi:hypothetical protein
MMASAAMAIVYQVATNSGEGETTNHSPPNALCLIRYQPPRRPVARGFPRLRHPLSFIAGKDPRPGGLPRSPPESDRARSFEILLNPELLLYLNPLLDRVVLERRAPRLLYGPKKRDWQYIHAIRPKPAHAG